MSIYRTRVGDRFRCKKCRWVGSDTRWTRIRLGATGYCIDKRSCPECRSIRIILINPAQESYDDDRPQFESPRD